MNIEIRRLNDHLVNGFCICKNNWDASQRRTTLELDEESLTSSKKPTEGEVVDKTTGRQTRPKQEQEQREVHKVSVKNLEAWFGTKQALKNINLDVKEKTVTAFIGPSGCGKTTLIRCFNRMQ